MDKIKIGIKTWSNNTKVIEQLKTAYSKGIISYVEIYVVPGTSANISLFKAMNIPIVIHSTHSKHNVNIAKKELLEYNTKMFKEVVLFTEKLNSETIILHADYDGTNTAAIACLKNFESMVKNSGMITVENMPKIALDGTECLGQNAEMMKAILQDKYSFCLDFSHAYKAAFALGKEPKKLINELLELEPKLFHLSGAGSYTLKDDHLNLFDKRNEMDNSFVKKAIKKSKSKMVTIETPVRNLESIEEDLRNIEFLEEL